MQAITRFVGRLLHSRCKSKEQYHEAILADNTSACRENLPQHYGMLRNNYVNKVYEQITA